MHHQPLRGENGIVISVEDNTQSNNERTMLTQKTKQKINNLEAQICYP